MAEEHRLRMAYPSQHTQSIVNHKTSKKISVQIRLSISCPAAVDRQRGSLHLGLASRLLGLGAPLEWASWGARGLAMTYPHDQVHGTTILISQHYCHHRHVCDHTPGPVLPVS